MGGLLNERRHIGPEGLRRDIPRSCERVNRGGGAHAGGALGRLASENQQEDDDHDDDERDNSRDEQR